MTKARSQSKIMKMMGIFVAMKTNTHTHTHPTVVPKFIRNILFPTILRGAEEVDESRAIQIEKILRCSTFV